MFSYILDDRIICSWWLGVLNIRFNVSAAFNVLIKKFESLSTSKPNSLFITTQLTQPTDNFSRHNYATWAFGFEIFIKFHSLLYHLTNDPSLLLNPSYASWSQLGSAIITWISYSIEQSIAESLPHIKPTCSL